MTRRHRLAPYLFLSPALLLLCVFLLWPLARSLALSFYLTAGPRTEKFVGFGNYRFLIFWLAAINTALFTLGFLLIQIPLSLALAMLLNSRQTRARSLLRFCFFSTYLCGQVFVAVIFFALLGHHPLNVPWLTDSRWTMITLLLAAIWLSTGYAMVFLLAALSAVRQELYEAAQLDGAGPWTSFRHVTLTGIRPMLAFLILVGTITGFQLFELPYVLFQGPGPGYRALTIVMYLYSAGFDRGDLGYASAIGWLMVLVLGFVAAIELRLAAERT